MQRLINHVDFEAWHHHEVRGGRGSRRPVTSTLVLAFPILERLGVHEAHMLLSLSFELMRLSAF